VPVPWRSEISQRTLIIRLPEAYRFLSWASLGGGLRLADAIINHQVRLDDRRAVEYPRAHLIRQAELLGLDTRRVVGMMTGADVRKAADIALTARGVSGRR
jgi:adenosylcobinamide amidohydrolase